MDCSEIQHTAYEQLAFLCETGSPNDQNDLMLRAFRKVHPAPLVTVCDLGQWLSMRRRLVSLLEAYAYENAALFVLPPAWFVADCGEAPHAHVDVAGLDRGPFSWAEIHRRDGKRAKVATTAKTPALAIAAASLRANAIEIAQGSMALR